MVAIKESELNNVIGPRHPVGVVVFDSEQKKVLLVKHGPKASRKEGLFGIPGGRPRPLETVADAALRELAEETGIAAERQHLIRLGGVYRGILKRENGDKHYLLDVVIATSHSGELTKSDETEPLWANIHTLNRRKRLMPSVEDIVNDALRMVK